MVFNLFLIFLIILIAFCIKTIVKKRIFNNKLLFNISAYVFCFFIPILLGFSIILIFILTIGLLINNMYFTLFLSWLILIEMIFLFICFFIKINIISCDNENKIFKIKNLLSFSLFTSIIYTIPIILLIIAIIITGIDNIIMGVMAIIFYIILTPIRLVLFFPLVAITDTMILLLFCSICVTFITYIVLGDILALNAAIRFFDGNTKLKNKKWKIILTSLIPCFNIIPICYLLKEIKEEIHQ